MRPFLLLLLCLAPSVAPAFDGPTFTPSGGIHAESQTVAIAAPPESLGIYYTTDGSTPTTASAVYSSPILISASGELRAIYLDANSVESDVSMASYIIDPMRFEAHATASLTAELHRLLHFVSGVGLAALVFKLCGFGYGARMLVQGGTP